MKVDYVIPFVTNDDPVWQSVYNRYSPSLKREARSRDWGVLKYQLRSIEKFMPWINNIFIVLSIGDTQIPKWLNKSNKKLHIVYDWEIVPKQFLPTFNSNTIDLHIPNIKELSEHYLYACDDYLITKPNNVSDFFKDDKIGINIIKYNFKLNIYSSSVINSVNMFYPESVIKHIINNNVTISVPYCNHTVTPNIKSENLKLLEEKKTEIEKSLTMFRTPNNLTWLIYVLNLQKQNKIFTNNIKVKLHRLVSRQDADNIDFDDCDVIVLNDNYKDVEWLKIKEKLITKLDEFLPIKSQFEI